MQKPIEIEYDFHGPKRRVCVYETLSNGDHRYVSQAIDTTGGVPVEWSVLREEAITKAKAVFFAEATRRPENESLTLTVQI